MFGICPLNEVEQWPDTVCDSIYRTFFENCSKLFVKFIGNRTVSDDILKCYSYDAVFVDGDTKENMNRSVVREGLAEKDPITFGALDAVHIDWRSLQSDDEKDWDDELSDPGSDLRSRGPNRVRDYISDGNFEDSDQWDCHNIDDFVSIPLCRTKFVFRCVTPRYILHFQFTQLTGIPVPPNEPAVPALKAIEAGNGTKNDASEGNSTTPKTNPRKASTEEMRKSTESARLQCVLPHKMPYIDWKQTDHWIKMSIAARDVTDYSLKVTPRSVHFG